ncbi:STAS domain-containing protein [Streptomyces formicae]
MLFPYQVTSHLVVPVEDIIDIANAPGLRVEFTRLVERTSARSVIIDFRPAVLTLAGVEVLEDTHAAAVHRSLPLGVSAPHRLARKVLHLTGADRLFPVHPDLPTALQPP